MLRSIKELGEFIEIQSNALYKRDKLSHLTNRAKELYDVIKSQSNLDDQLICNILYPKGKRKSYVKLKERLYKQLIEIAFKIESEDEKVGFAQIRERCIKQAAILKILLFRGLPLNVEETSKRLMNICVQYQFNDLLKDILLVNLELYGRGYQNAPKFNRMYRQYQEVSKVLEIEK